jgi:SNF2 family DNA or RNA helicase
MRKKYFLEKEVNKTVLNKALKYYQQGNILQYRVKQLAADLYLVKATVSESAKYQVQLSFKLASSEFEIKQHNCNCKEQELEFCQHQVAVIYKFLTEDYKSQKLRDNIVLTGQNNALPADQIVRQKIKQKSFARLLRLKENLQPEQQQKLSYKVKGLSSPGLKNFSLQFDSEQISSHEIEEVVDSLNSDQAGYYEQSLLANLFAGRELELLKKLASLVKRKGRSQNSLLLTKSENSLDFLLELAAGLKVLLHENKKQLQIGKQIKADFQLTGDLNKVKFELADNDLEIYWGENKDCCWTLVDNCLHKVKVPILQEIPAQFWIPPSNQGEFLFEVLPALQENNQLTIASNLTDYNLITEEPAVKLSLDYQADEISCQLAVAFAEQKYFNTELLSLDTDHNLYQQDLEDPKTWYSRDNQALATVLNFLDEYNFKVRPGEFVIKASDDIQEFITDGYPHIPEEWEVEVSNSFDKLEIKTVKLEPIIEFDDSDGINWFDFNISYNLGGISYSRQEIMDLISYNRKGEAYLKFANQYYILENSRQEEKLSQVLENSQTQADSYRAPYYSLLYYRKLIGELGIEFREQKVFNQLAEDITSQKVVERSEVPSAVKNILRDYQVSGFNWLNFLVKYNFGGILADEMGLGKTLQVLTLIKNLALPNPALVLCPRTLIYNWQEEAEKFFPDLKTLVYYGQPEERQVQQQQFKDFDLIISSYATISRDVKQLNQAEISFALLILDEAQHIKNHRTKRAAAVKKISAQHRLALTGTPLENSLAELWSIFDFLMPGYLGNFNYFRKKYLLPIKNNQADKILLELKERIAPFILRRSKKDVLQELPEKVINLHPVSMTQLQEDSYKTVLEEVKGELYQQVSQQGFNNSRLNVLAALTKLRQICDHPYLVLGEKGKNHKSGKLEALKELIMDAVQSGHKLIVFSQFVKMLKLIRQELKKVKIKYQYLDGATRNRMARVKSFNQDPEISVFLISLKAGGVGLNLTAADIVIHVDPWWNPMVENQATDRAHRLGQQNKVMVYKLIARGTVEEKMVKLKNKKQLLFDNIIENNINPIDAVSWEDIQQLFSY